jgi:hypothetical protein
LVTGTKQPWLGNCVATAYLMGGPAPGPQGDEDQGLGIVQAISKGWQVGFHLFNALDTRCTGCQANGAAQLHDKSEIGIWYDAATDETLWAGGGVHAYGTALLHAPTAQTNCDIYSGNDLETAVHDGFDFVHIEGCLQIIGSHTHNAADAYISAGAVNTVLQGNFFPNGELYYENSGVAANTAAVGNTFKNGIVDQTILGALGIGSAPAQPLTIGSAASGSGMCLYNTSDQTTNYERSCLRWTSNASVVATEKGGTGVSRDLTLNAASGKINLQNNGTTKFTVGSAINGGATGAQFSSSNASGTFATLVPNRAATSSTGIGADTAGDVSVVVGANEDVRFDASHHTTLKGGAPSSSGNTVVGNDLVGRITLGSGGSAVILAFNQFWTNTPICFAQDETTAAANPLYASTTNPINVTFTVTGSTNMAASDKISYRCLGYR